MIDSANPSRKTIRRKYPELPPKLCPTFHMKKKLEVFETFGGDRSPV
jgi:hypothetical protein